MEQEYPPISCERYRSPRPIDPNLLHSNHVPTAAEVSQTLKLLEEETKELDDLRRRLDQMEARKQSLEAHMDRRRSIISVQRKLPVELWENIFTIVCSSSSSDGYSLRVGYSRVVDMFPITLTHVCSRWRVIVTGCSRLWASIHVFHYVCGAQRLVETFLTNSGACPLDLRIDLTLHTEAIWEILTHHISRSERLRVLNEVNRKFLAVFHYRHVTFNNLLSFVGLKYTQLDINPFWKALRQAPKLTKVELDSVWPLNSLPYSQLTALTINHVYLDEVDNLLQVLEVSVNLHYLHLECDDDGATLDIVPRRVELPSLRTLVVCQVEVPIDNAVLDAFFSSMVLPALTTLELSCRSSRENMTLWPSSLVTMLRHSSTTLTDMSLSLVPFSYSFNYTSGDSVSILLATVPHLAHFKFDNIQLSTPADMNSLPCNLLPKELTYVSHESPILPELETLSIRGIQLNHDIVKQILDLAASRSLSRLPAACYVRPLTRLDVVPYEGRDTSPYFLKPWVLAAIDGLEREGVKVVIEEPLYGP